MVTYKRNFKKIVWGFEEAEANDLREAEKKFSDGDCDVFDNKSDVEYEDICEE